MNWNHHMTPRERRAALETQLTEYPIVTVPGPRQAGLTTALWPWLAPLTQAHHNGLCARFYKKK